MAFFNFLNLEKSLLKLEGSERRMCVLFDDIVGLFSGDEFNVAFNCSTLRKDKLLFLFAILSGTLQKPHIPCHFHFQERKLLVSMPPPPLHLLLICNLPTTSESVFQLPSHSRD